MGAAIPRFHPEDPHLFGYVGNAVAVFDAGPKGRIEIHTRSLAKIMDYLGTLTQITLRSPADVSIIRTEAGRQRLFLVQTGFVEGPTLAAVEFKGTQYAIPSGPEAGQSGNALSIVTQLLAQAQSVKDLPVSNAVTIVGD